MSLVEKIKSGSQKKILALDGGGIRGILSVEILAKIETVLREKLGKDEKFVLADYFDFIAGTSTGGIIAACLSWGMTVDRIRDFYLRNGKEMFDKAVLRERFRHKFSDEKLAQRLQDEFKGETLGSDKLRTLLMLVMRNASTDSPWPVSNNPGAKYNDRKRPDCNLRLAAVAVDSGEYRGSDLFSARGSPIGKQRIHLRRRRHYHVQQPGVPGFSDGNRRALQSELARG